MIFGYSPDWQNYLLLSKYAGKNIPTEDIIACRKPGMSFIFGNHKFYGISRVPTLNTDDIFKEGYKYFLIPTGKLIYRLPQSMLKAIITGKTGNAKTDKLKSFLLFETDSNMNISQIKSYEITKEAFSNRFTELSIISPDYLRDKLKENNVKYVIIANLRRDPKKKTKYTINTVKRYTSYISIKYPSFLSKVYEVGKDEKATLYKLNYN